MASLLSLPGGYYEQKAYLREAVRLGIPLLRPDINSSGFGFCSEEYGIRVGLDAVKGCGPEAVASLVRSRRKDGDFMSLADFLDRMKDSRVGMQILRGWIASGACDCFGLSRRYMLNILGERDFGTVRNVSVQSYTAETEDDRIMEKRALGFPLHSAPSPRWIQFTDRYNIVNITSLACSARRSRVRICGIVVYSRRSKSADGNYFLSLVVQDLTGMVEVVLYPDIYKMCLYELNPNGMMIEGIVKSDDGTARVIAQRIKALSSA
jgi:DNA polymerase-3 subunit alpha